MLNLTGACSPKMGFRLGLVRNWNSTNLGNFHDGICTPSEIYPCQLQIEQRIERIGNCKSDEFSPIKNIQKQRSRTTAK